LIVSEKETSQNRAGIVRNSCVSSTRPVHGRRSSYNRRRSLPLFLSLWHRENSVHQHQRRTKASRLHGSATVAEQLSRNGGSRQHEQVCQQDVEIKPARDKIHVSRLRRTIFGPSGSMSGEPGWSSGLSLSARPVTGRTPRRSD
jgi:hypothetical protein